MPTSHVMVRRGDAWFEVPVPGFVGRSTACSLVLDDPAVATAHLELGQREARVVVWLLRGELHVNDLPVVRAEVEVGQVWRLAPGVELEVTELVAGAGDQVATVRTGPVPVRWWTKGEDVYAESAVARVEVQGIGAAILKELLASRAGVPWEDLALRHLRDYRGDAFFGEDDRRRGRNALDRQLTVLRQRLASLGRRESMVYTHDGDVYLHWTRLDRYDVDPV